MRITATDAGSAVAAISHSATGAATIPQTTTPGDVLDVSIATAGVTAVRATATDSRGNTSEPRTVAVRLDPSLPNASITIPADGGTYRLGATATADFACVDEVSDIRPGGCEGTVADGAPIDTTTAGPKTFTVTATDLAGNRRERTITARPQCADGRLHAGRSLRGTPARCDPGRAVTDGAQQRLYIGGGFATVRGAPRENLAALDAHTGALLDWSPTGVRDVTALAADGSSVYAGSGTPVALEGGNALSEISADGSLSPWAPAPDGGVDVLRAGGGHLDAGGDFRLIGGAEQPGFASFSLAPVLRIPAPRGRAQHRGPAPHAAAGRAPGWHMTGVPPACAPAAPARRSIPLTPTTAGIC